MIASVLNNMERTCRVAAVILALAAATGVAAASPASPLATPDEFAVEKLAIELLQTPEVINTEKATLAQFESSVPNASAEEEAIIRNAVHELAFVSALGAANSDTTRPKIVWFGAAPRTWFGRDVPGSRIAIDNPDNVYRFVRIDSASKYEVTFHPTQPGPVQYSFIIYDNFIGETGNFKTVDAAISALSDRDIKTAPDGSFKITIDNTPANDRSNHLQSTPQAKILLIRNTFNDWGTQKPFAVEIRRVGGAAPTKPASKQALARVAADYINGGAGLIKIMRSGALQRKQPINTFAQPGQRGGGWGFVTGGGFKLASDEALVLTLDPRGGKYLSVDLTDPWMVSREHVRANGSLNNGQAEASRDGTYTYVISAKDPGVRNWLDTSGLLEGSLLIRWQELPQGVTSIDGAVKQAKVVKLSELATVLPPEATKVSPVQRKADYQARAVSYAHRYQ